PLLLVTGALRVTQEILRYCWVNVLCLFVLALSLGIPSLKGLAGLCLRTGLLGASLGYTYWILRLYEPFAGYPPVVGGLGVLFAASTLAVHFLHKSTLPERSVVFRRLGLSLSPLAF